MTIIGISTTYKKQTPYIPKDIGVLHSTLDGVYLVLCGLGTVRILRALRFRKYFQQMEDEVQRFLATMGLDIVVMILFSEFLLQSFCFYF